MQNIINTVKGTALGVAGLLTPVLKVIKHMYIAHFKLKLPISFDYEIIPLFNLVPIFKTNNLFFEIQCMYIENN